MLRYPRKPAAIVLAVAGVLGVVVISWGRGGPSGDRAHWSLEELEVAIAGGDADAQTWFLLGSRLQDRHSFENAAAAYKKALDKDPSLREARFNCGAALAQAGNEDAFYAYMHDMVVTEPKMAEDFFERPECRPWLAKPRFEALKKEAQVQAMD